ncbi:hypothetical protein OKC48_06895 [Methylorubrum extorquens]|uniref:hypothetical protein n=1 Tax=Methylorubrum extorquens TaxID=408 RepID=UPI0022386C63|nr:hypothetical protein [Methylorubrum extorquens]UYW28241.1 hypothetical protein OKC48_06895 [Methylorubrum extorquens]
MNFSWDINLGHLLTLLLAMIGLIGGYVTIRIKTADNEEKTKALGTRVEAYGIALADLRLHVSEHCVKKDDLEKVEDRIGRRLDTVEHTIRNMTTTILGAINGRGRTGRGGGEA